MATRDALFDELPVVQPKALPLMDEMTSLVLNDRKRRYSRNQGDQLPR